MTFLSTPSARRATKKRGDNPYFESISIHALREEGDLAELQNIMMRAISIHALREEGDNQPDFIADFYFIFLSTPSARRATYFAACRSSLYAISIHALREEGDPDYKSGALPT